MTPIKLSSGETVYLPTSISSAKLQVGTIDEKDYYKSFIKECNVNEQTGYFFTPEQLNQFISNVIKDTLDTAAEKATLLADGKLTYYNRYIVQEGNHYSEIEIDVDKQSITNTFDITYKKHKI